tara:strand:+ start:5603 stop:6325 length:723 start_codon:yes stop_codon:yes gene_type:complete
MYQAIIEKQNQIFLEEETHTYTVLNSNINFISVTEFINTFFSPFDEQKIASNLSGKGKYKQMSTEDILIDWKERRDRGTIVHKELENFINHSATDKEIDKLDLKSKQGVSFLKEKCINEQNILFSEVKIVSEKLQLAGTIDLMIYNKNKNRLYLIDWKTNINIKKTGYKKGIVPPANLIDDCSFNRYKLQLSVYRYILENYYNVSVDGLYIAHLTNESYTIMGCDFEQRYVTEMIQSRAD